ncbi:hypothetical protein GBA65_16650 [Rubrobacter marinus]|uniref:Ester cyclase n=1 Tax=Rubrobacter marinus TaxID=2653852 RepID=A0A6G8Q0N5_9ACTN|nr:ester cyclase [Rubrobacter marinus]QIN79887.1 hypothetical protein GBA65_16650 [Rubrobacter marinus]
MRKVLERWFAGVSYALSSSRWLRWGGRALVAGGLLGVAAQVFFVLLFGVFPLSSFALASNMLEIVYLLRGVVVPLVLAVGLVGLYALTAGRPGRLGRWASVGLGLVLASAVVLVGMNAYETLVAPRYIAYSPDQGIPLTRTVLLWAGWGWPAGAVLLGVGTLGVRGLGIWRPLPLALGLLSTPLAYRIFLHAVTSGNPEGGVRGISRVLLDAQPMLLNLGWVLLGYVLLRAKGAEPVVQRNQRLARRLYEEAWGRGQLGVLDEIAAPGVVDHYHGQRGRENLKRSVAGLRASFPDLRFSLEEQEAEEDRVTTRWTASGTDEGGVLWYPPTGRAATFSGVFTDRFEDGRLVEHWGESDTPGLLRRLGLPPKG